MWKCHHGISTTPKQYSEISANLLFSPLFSQYLMVQLTIAHAISTNSTSLLPDLVYAFNESLLESRNIFLYDIHYSMVFSLDETKRYIYIGFPVQATVIKTLENIKKIVQNSHLDVFFKIDVFKNFAKLTGKPCTIESSLIKLETRPAIFFTKRYSGTSIFCEICKIFKSIFFYRKLRWLAGFQNLLKIFYTFISVLHAMFFLIYFLMGWWWIQMNVRLHN